MIYFYGCTSIDGYLADKNHGLKWLFESGSPEETDYDSFYKKMDISIMGKKTFDAVKDVPDIQSEYSGTKNYVFTHSDSLPVNGFIPVSGDVVEFVKRFSREENIWIVGGNQILAPLIDHDMVDTLVIQIAPVLLGAGIPLFTQKEALKRYRLEKVNQYGQFAEMVYQK